ANDNNRSGGRLALAA
ncbi:tmRNA-encoded proteolysis-inducing tag, partial [Rickettsia endosymbiont of Ixodes scapularis]